MILADYTLGTMEDGSLNVVMNPPVPISGWSIQFSLMHRFGSDSPFYIASLASGYSNLNASGFGISGITLVNGATGQIRIAIPESATSGLQYGNYASMVQKLNPWPALTMSEGYLILTP